jgi:hypothetical protein
MPTHPIVASCEPVYIGTQCVTCRLADSVFISPQDSNPAGTIFAEDIVDVAPDEYESKKDSKVSVSFEGAQSSQSTVALSFSPQHGFVFKILTRGRDYIFNAPNQQKRVNS